jgi:protoporphyrinogen/coproporphyrinogen III oxidase
VPAVRIAILGRGISGLAAAHFLTRAGHDVVSIDPSPEPGGLVRSERIDGFLCESGPQALLNGPAETRALIADAGLEARVIGTSTSARRRFIHAGGRLHPLPTNPIAFARSGLLGWRGKLRLLREPFVRAASPDGGDESVLAFGARRFGPEAARAFLAPAVIGIYAGDAAQLSMRSAFPRLAELERAHGSVIRGAIAQRRPGSGGGGGAGRVVSFPDGLQELARALAAALGARRIVARADGIERTGDGWRVTLAAGGTPIDAQAVVIATEAASAAALLDALAPGAAAAVRSVRLAPVVVVGVGFRAGGPPLGMNLDAYGFLVARGAGSQARSQADHDGKDGDGDGDRAGGLSAAAPPIRVLGCQYESSIFAGRAPAGGVLLRAILGGTFDPGIIDQPDDAIAAVTIADLRRLTGLARDPDLVRIWRHPASIPQYELGHAAKVAAADLDLARHPGLFLIGHSLRGVGLNDCIATAAALARQIA